MILKLPFAWGYKFDEFALFEFYLPGDTSNSRNSSSNKRAGIMISTLWAFFNFQKFCPCVIESENSTSLFILISSMLFIILIV